MVSYYNCKEIVSSGSHLEEPIGFSRACRIGNSISVSGTAPINNGKTVHIGDVYNQTKYCLELSITAIEEAGGNIQDVIRTRICSLIFPVGKKRHKHMVICSRLLNQLVLLSR